MKFTNKIKTLSAIITASVALVGCQSQSNTLTFTPPAPTASMGINQSAVVYVMSRDSRNHHELANYTKSGEMIKLTSNPTLTQLFQQVMQQNLISKGFRIGYENNSNAGVTIDIREFYTDVKQGNLRYNLDTKIQVNVFVQGVRGQFNKVFSSSNSQSGAFNADNDEIQKVQTRAFNDIVKNIYQDQEIGAAISQYSN